jgi:hypothetical protein
MKAAGLKLTPFSLSQRSAETMAGDRVQVSSDPAAALADGANHRM